MTAIRKKPFITAVILWGLGAAGLGWAAEKPYSLYETSPLVKLSYYTLPILKFLDQWPPPTSALHDERPTLIRAVRTPTRPDTVGMVKHYSVPASLDKVVELTERFEDYPKIWDDVLSVNVQSRDKNRVVTEWLRKAPAFFLAKTHYTMLYTIDKTFPNRVVYLEQLIDGNAPKTSDTLVVLEKDGEASTQVSVVSFYEADFGPLRGVIEGKIWQKSMEGSYKDDLSFINRAQHPEWSLDQIKDAVDHIYDQHPIDSVEYTDLLKFN